MCKNPMNPCIRPLLARPSSCDGGESGGDNVQTALQNLILGPTWIISAFLLGRGNCAALRALNTCIWRTQHNKLSIRLWRRKETWVHLRPWVLKLVRTKQRQCGHLSGRAWVVSCASLTLHQVPLQQRQNLVWGAAAEAKAGVDSLRSCAEGEGLAMQGCSWRRGYPQPTAEGLLSRIFAIRGYGRRGLSKKSGVQQHRFTSSLSVFDFDLLRVVGKGAFGKVMLVRKKQGQVIFRVLS